jgi:hypothetical protein
MNNEAEPVPHQFGAGVGVEEQIIYNFFTTILYNNTKRIGTGAGTVVPETGYETALFFNATL